MLQFSPGPCKSFWNFSVETAWTDALNNKFDRTFLFSYFAVFKGTWSSWTTSSCSNTCGAGIKIKTRTCPEGRVCDGLAQATLACNEKDCFESTSKNILSLFLRKKIMKKLVIVESLKWIGLKCIAKNLQNASNKARLNDFFIHDKSVWVSNFDFKKFKSFYVYLQ